MLRDLTAADRAYAEGRHAEATARVEAVLDELIRRATGPDPSAPATR